MESYEPFSKPNLYNKAVIFFAALALTPFFGSLLFAQNLLEIGKRKKVFPIVLFASIWNVAVFQLTAQFFHNSLLAYFLGNALGGFLLVFPIWKLYFSKVDFQKKSVWSPLLVIVFIYALFSILILWLRK